MMMSARKGHASSWCLILILWMNWGANVHAKTDMPSDAFIEGFRHELANRDFAMQTAERLSKRLEGEAQHPFWQAYLKLEQFNAPRYQSMASGWGLDSTSSWTAGAKAFAISLVPTIFMETALKSAYSRTVSYVEKLRELRDIGPSDSQYALDYMVAQEELQVEMMELALSGDYEKIPQRVDEFILQHQDVPSAPVR